MGNDKDHDLTAPTQTEKNRRAIFGDKGTNGLMGRLARVEQDLYYDERTRRNGIVQEVAKIKWIIYGLLFAIIQNMPDFIKFLFDIFPFP
jgi:hypothetical protein